QRKTSKRLGERFTVDATHALGGAAMTWPLAVRAQQTWKVPRVGILDFFPSADCSRKAAVQRTTMDGREGRVEDGRGRLGHAATRRFPSPLVEPDVPISGIRLSDGLHRG